MAYPWYQSLTAENNELLQGDLIEACPVILPPNNMALSEDYELDVEEHNVIVISHSCDLENNKLDFVLVCPYRTFDEYVSFLPLPEQKSKGALKNHFEKLKQGYQPNYHLLDKDPENRVTNYIVVDFRNVYAVHINYLKEYVKNLGDRLRLLPPYREHLSQAFARFFMRVGLPQNISSFNPDQYTRL